MAQLRQVAPIVVTLLLGCGALKTPDLQHGVVNGRIVNAQQGAYAYVLGKPEVFTQIGADGTFHLEGVPAGDPQIVVFDGATGAEALTVDVEGATESRLDLDRPLELAAVIVAVHSPLSGVRPSGLNFTVAGTPLRQVNGEEGARLFPLPAGKFTIHAEQPGFVGHDWEVDVGEGQSASLEVELEIENDDRGGCRSSGCEEGLSCNPSDGRCDLPIAQDLGTFCQGCRASGNNCQNTLYCAVGGYCSADCASSNLCPSGYDCKDGACVAPTSCLELVASYGSACSRDDSCGALKDGKCVPLARASGTVGYCSGKSQNGCPNGFVNPVPGDPNEYCVRATSP